MYYSKNGTTWYGAGCMAFLHTYKKGIYLKWNIPKGERRDKIVTLIKLWKKTTFKNSLSIIENNKITNKLVVKISHRKTKFNRSKYIIMALLRDICRYDDFLDLIYYLQMQGKSRDPLIVSTIAYTYTNRPHRFLDRFNYICPTFSELNLVDTINLARTFLDISYLSTFKKVNAEGKIMLIEISKGNIDKKDLYNYYMSIPFDYSGNYTSYIMDLKSNSLLYRGSGTVNLKNTKRFIPYPTYFNKKILPKLKRLNVN